MDIGVGVPSVHEPLTPIARGELAIGNGPTLEVERSQQPQAILERTAVRHDRGLDQPHFPHRATMRYGVDPGIHRHRVGPEPDPGGGPPPPSPGEQDPGDDQYGEKPSQSDSATAARPEVRLARRKSRFIRVMVSMLMSLGQASWHSP